MECSKAESVAIRRLDVWCHLFERPSSQILGGGDERNDDRSVVIAHLRQCRECLLVIFSDHESMVDDIVDVLGEDARDIREVDQHPLLRHS